MDPDSDAAIFDIDLQDTNKKLIFLFIFSAYYFLKLHLYNSSKIKSKKKSQNSRNQGFSYCFCMMIEGFGSGPIPLTNESGSGRPKNMWIRWIRIRNTAQNAKKIELHSSGPPPLNTSFSLLQIRRDCFPNRQTALVV
jgi:hypothetical protein